MCSIHTCIAFTNVKTTIRLGNDVVYLALDDKYRDTSVHVTINPLQVRTLAKYLSVALSQFDVNDIRDEQFFGDLTVEIEQDQSPDDESALAVPF